MVLYGVTMLSLYIVLEVDAASINPSLRNLHIILSEFELMKLHIIFLNIKLAISKRDENRCFWQTFFNRQLRKNILTPKNHVCISIFHLNPTICWHLNHLVRVLSIHKHQPNIALPLNV
ncbi:hypothetical protein BpHYR1_049188 [Brachionus plicatilis]|uniref:Uncharacterized protein n=1 Tax=Brachionus plicatilis TaxID=10195 RepID=A0A3M7S7R2_BRAPC|nr:hypothetical protein BpHYR1_049188 [Brachionus plicatilis]